MLILYIWYGIIIIYDMTFLYTFYQVHEQDENPI